MKVVKMIPYDQAALIVEKHGQTIGGFGGFFDQGMRWKDYVCLFTGEGIERVEALRRYIIDNKIKQGGDWHQSDVHGAPLFSDGKAATYSFRAWGDLLAAVWSEKEDKNYSYMSFYMDCYIPKD